jgi:DNA-binding beta-propeller fold protein YncE
MAYVSCSGDGKVSAIDLANWKVAQTIVVGQGADGLVWAQ